MDDINCTAHISQGGAKDTIYIVEKMLPLMKSIDNDQQ